MARITAPTQGFNGSIGDVRFTDSVAITDDIAVIGYCQGAGYVVEYDDAEPQGPQGAPEKSWTVAQLKAWASEHAVDLGEATKKDDILAVILDPNTEKTAEPGEALPVIPADPSLEQTQVD